MLNPSDIRNDKRVSGYDHVGKNDGGVTHAKPYQADVYGGKNDTAGRRWKGPRRSTALEAAQDYCDYVNGLDPSNAPVTLKVAGHDYTVNVFDRDEEYQAALGVLRDRKAQLAGRKGYVYCITEEGCGEFIKVGYSVNPQKRVAELQTANPRRLKLLATMEGSQDDERKLHARYIKDNVLQEWFKVSAALLAEFNLKEAK